MAGGPRHRSKPPQVRGSGGPHRGPTPPVKGGVPKRIRGSPLQGSRWRRRCPPSAPTHKPFHLSGGAAGCREGFSPQRGPWFRSGRALLVGPIPGSFWGLWRSGPSNGHRHHPGLDGEGGLRPRKRGNFPLPPRRVRPQFQLPPSGREGLRPESPRRGGGPPLKTVREGRARKSLPVWSAAEESKRWRRNPLLLQEHGMSCG